MVQGTMGEMNLTNEGQCSQSQQYTNSPADPEAEATGPLSSTAVTLLRSQTVPSSPITLTDTMTSPDTFRGFCLEGSQELRIIGKTRAKPSPNLTETRPIISQNLSVWPNFLGSKRIVGHSPLDSITELWRSTS